MSEQAAARPAKPPRNRDVVRDSLVLICMTVVALALGIGLHLQFAMAFWLAVVAALSVYVALISAHVLIRRSERVDELQRELDRLEARLGRRTAAGPPRAGLGPTIGPAERLEVKPVVAASPASPAATGSLEDYWSFKPAEVQAVSTPPAAAPPVAPRSAAPAAARSETVTPAAKAPPRETVPERAADAEQINAVIKKIAADITSGQSRIGADDDQIGRKPADARAPQAKPIEDAPAVPAPAPPVLSAATSVPASDDTVAAVSHVAAHLAPARPMPPPVPPVPSVPAMADIDDSVAALHAAADAMREAGRTYDQVRADSDLAAAGRVAPPPLPSSRSGAGGRIDPAQAQLAAVADALERERFDVLLQPIRGLADRRAQHYVVLARLRDGLASDPSALAATGIAPGSGLLPLLDACKIDSAARVAWRMEDRAKSGSLFSQLSGESLVSDRFLNRFADTYRQGDTLGSRLVLSFRQAEVRLFSELQWATLRDMADLGFRFCLDDITDLDIDLGGLVAAGFTFVRLDAPVFMDGLMAEGGIIPAADICRHFAALNLAVIVGGIADEAVSVQLQAYGVQLGLGELFGPARVVKTDVLRKPHAAVA